MKVNGRIVALDGHDGAGKTTLAKELARSINGTYRRTFQGDFGLRLIQSAEAQNWSEVITIGEHAIKSAIEGPPELQPLVLDRGWMTVASLVPWVLFLESWTLWLPTVLCWANLETTQERLRARTESLQRLAYHQHFLEKYRALADLTGTPILRTDKMSGKECHVQLESWFRELEFSG